MKRIGNLYEKISTVDNVKSAIKNASKGKTKRNYVKKILENIDYYALEISNMLKNKAYIPSENRYKTIYDTSSNKERLITIPKFYPDQIVHWCIVQVLQPIFMHGMYQYCCGSVPKRGGMAAKKYIEKVKNKKKARYVLKMDIKKFFPHISHAKLMSLLEKKIKDKDTLALLFLVIEAGGAGLPIGYYTSQWLSNFYLQEVDHFIKEKLKIKYYVRYVDDLVLIHNNKRELHKTRIALSSFFRKKSYNLTIKDNWQLWKINTRPIDFVGYRFCKAYTLLRKKIFYRLNRTAKSTHTLHNVRRFISLIGWAKHIYFRGFYLTTIKPFFSMQQAKMILHDTFCKI